MQEGSELIITAVIPAYNESLTIGRIVTEALQHAKTVVVVDDGSLDSTDRVAAEAGATVLRHTKNLGYGAALSTGFQYFRNNGAGIMVVLDGDGQHAPAEIPRLVKPLLEGQADIAIGSRFINQEHSVAVPRYRKFGIGMVNKAWRIASGDVLTDTQCGFRAYTREAVDKMEIKESNMSASLEILGQAADKNLRIVEVPVSVNYEGSTSTMKPGRHGIELVNYVLRKLKEEHPLLIFGGSGVILTIVGITFGILSVNSYFETRYLPFGPTMIAAIAIYLGTLMIFGGLILNAIQNLAARLDDKRLR